MLVVGSQELARRQAQLQHNINEIPVPLFLHVAKTGGECNDAFIRERHFCIECRVPPFALTLLRVRRPRCAALLRGGRYVGLIRVK